MGNFNSLFFHLETPSPQLRVSINMLPSEIMLDILTRLPAESVLECKLVCKPWRDVVQHPSFSQMHLSHLIDSGKSSCIFYSREPGLNKYYYSEYDENCHEEPFNTSTRMTLNPPFQDYSFVGSCNGLICFKSWCVGYNAFNYHHGPAYICNPITREYIMLPTSLGYFWWTGFGYILSTDEYKVVRIYASEGDSNVGIVHIYTLGSGDGWIDAGMMDINMNRVRKGAGAFANGALHWMDKKGTTILAFDLADEKFSKLPSTPPCLARADIPYFGSQLGVLADFLSATYYYDAGDSDVWLLRKNEDNNDISWSKEFSFDSHISQPFEFTKSGRLLCFGHNTIYSYDPKALSAKRDVSFGKPISHAIRHKNTLVSLKVLERASSSEETENSDKLKKPQNKVRDQLVGFYAMGVKKFIVAIQKLHLPKCC